MILLNIYEYSVIQQGIQMQNIQKRKKEYFKDFLFKRVDSVPSLPILYAGIVLLNMLCDGCGILQYALQSTVNLYNFASVQFFYTQIGLLIGFFVISGLSAFSVFLAHFWIYYLMIIQASAMFYIRNLAICINSSEGHICYGQISFKIATAALFIIYALIIIIFRGNAYFPFQNVNHLFSIRQNYSTLFLLIFRTLTGFILYHDLIPNSSQQKKALFILAFILFWKSRHSGQMNQFSRKVWDIYYYSICWTCFSIFVADYLKLVNDSTSLAIFSTQLTYQQVALYFWAYTFPFAIAIPIFSSSTVSGQFWMNILGPNGHQLETIYDKNEIYIICNQSYQVIDEIGKSQMKFKDSQFKKLWNSIKLHNQRCVNLKCPLHQLEQFKTQISEDSYQQKKFSKTLRVCLEYVRVTIEKLKQKFPDNMEVELQIAYFHLICMKNKQKGMLLYNEFNRNKSKKENKAVDYEKQEKEENRNQMQKKTKRIQKETHLNSNYISFDTKYAVHYLKKKIDKVFSKEKKQSQTNVDNQISEFRQKIQISVTMLAQFWSILADPKCNLKKMYELTNVLFPLKLSIEEDWERVKQLKDVQTYAIYAKYLIRMFNDKQKGIKIIQQAKRVEYELKNKEQAELDEKGGEMVQENGIICMEYDGKNSGVMFQVNQNGEKLFGYNRKQLLNKKVNQIMPIIYAREHDKILQNYLQTSYSTMMNKQRHIWGKTKNGFLIPVIILIKPILSFYTQASNSEVYASIKKQQYLRQIIAIIIDENEFVYQYTSTALRVFPLIQENHKKRNRDKANGKTKQTSDKKLSHSLLNISELIQNFSEIKQRVLTENEQYEYKTQRQITINRNGKQKIIEQCVYNVQINEIVLKTKGKIGCLVKFTKVGNTQYIRSQKSIKQSGQKSLNQKRIDNQESSENKMFNFNGKQSSMNKNNNNNKQVKFNLDVPRKNVPNNLNGRRKFIFSYDIAEKQKIFQTIKQIQAKQNEEGPVGDPSQSKKRLLSNKINKKALYDLQPEEMKYIGGFTTSADILEKFRADTLSTFKAKLKVSEMQYEQNRIDYSIGIKTKRLHDKNIRELREQSEEIEYKKNQESEQKSQRQAQLRAQIKPSQVALILSKGSQNNLITYLRFLTILLLVLCSVASIVELIVVKGIKQKTFETIVNLKLLNQIKTEVFNINFFVSYLTAKKEQNLLTFHNFHRNIDELDYKLNQYTFQTNTQLSYSDGSKDNYFLGFALNKFISQANSLTLSNDTGLINSAEPSVYFVRYNTVNGICISLNNQYSYLEETYNKLVNNKNLICLIFIGAVALLCLIILVIKNFILRLVIQKKTQILGVFFQIPRFSCNIIQKQCELFILRITSQNEDEELQLSNNGQFQEMNKGGEKVQKKRTIVGEENTIVAFSFVSLLFLLFLLIFQITFQVLNEVQNKSVNQITNQAQFFFDIEYKLLELTVNMESYAQNETIPIANSYNHKQVLVSQKTNLLSDVQNVHHSLFQIMSILDAEFGEKTTSLFYKSLCGEKCENSQAAQISQGLNVVLIKYLQVIKGRYRELTANNSTLADTLTYQRQKLYANAMKVYWRQFTQLVCDSMKRFNSMLETINIWILVSVCVFNMIFCMGAWLKYYHHLEAKIVATEYILTFIPIDEINKNKKIAEFIKKQIITRK